MGGETLVNELLYYLMIIRQISDFFWEFATRTIYNPDVNLLVSMLAFFCPSWRFCEQTTCPAALTTVSDIGDWTEEMSTLTISFLRGMTGDALIFSGISRTLTKY